MLGLLPPIFSVETCRDRTQSSQSILSHRTNLATNSLCSLRSLAANSDATSIQSAKRNAYLNAMKITEESFLIHLSSRTVLEPI